MASLGISFVNSIGTTKLMETCVEFIKAQNGFSHQGGTMHFHRFHTSYYQYDVAHIFLLLFTVKYYHFSHRYFIRYVMPYSFNRNQAKPFFLLLCAGIFRVPGDEIELNLAKIRLQNAKKVCTYTFNTCALHLSARNNTFCTYIHIK